MCSLNTLKYEKQCKGYQRERILQRYSEHLQLCHSFDLVVYQLLPYLATDSLFLSRGNVLGFGSLRCGYIKLNFYTTLIRSSEKRIS
jgi:hypothetical protein